MSLTVPAQQAVHIKRLLELPDDKIEGFLVALRKAGPQFNVYDLATGISGALELPNDLTLGIVQVLASLYRTRSRKQPIEKFVDQEVFSALKKAKTFPAENADVPWKKFRAFLVTALSLERSVGTAAKAGPVLTQHERIFDGARIMTDLRPVFHLNVSEKPEAALIIHMLKITQRDNFGHKVDQYFALDSNDVKVMQEVIERALTKEETLKGIMKNSGVTILNPKLTF